MMQGNVQTSVPPGFRFHPTDEELLYYYLRKKVAYEPIDLDVIREVDLNKLEPWDLKDRCRIGSGPQNEWYFFSRKDKKYPTGTSTNRATAVGFWKATGRDKAILHHCTSRRIGMRKTLVFYVGRAPNGQKTDWIMHEYRLEDHPLHDHPPRRIQEEGWVVCRVFKKETMQRGFHSTPQEEENHHHHHHLHLKPQPDHSHIPWSAGATASASAAFAFPMDTSMHLPQLLSAEAVVGTAFVPQTEVSCPILHERFDGDWLVLDKLLSSNQSLNQLFQERPSGDVGAGGSLMQRLPLLHYVGCEGDLSRLSK